MVLLVRAKRVRPLTGWTAKPLTVALPLILTAFFSSVGWLRSPLKLSRVVLFPAEHLIRLYRRSLGKGGAGGIEAQVLFVVRPGGLTAERNFEIIIEGDRLGCLSDGFTVFAVGGRHLPTEFK